jgi:hypothetical protein
LFERERGRLLRRGDGRHQQSSITASGRFTSVLLEHFAEQLLDALPRDHSALRPAGVAR